jgi:hypothetical protein
VADQDPVAEAAIRLAGYVTILEDLLAEPVSAESGAPPGVASRPAVSPEPWYGPAGRALMDAWEGVPRLEALLKYRGPAGRPGPRRGGSPGNFAAALKALPGLAAGLTAEDAQAAARILGHWVDAARSVHGIDERRRLRHLPRRAGEGLPPRCPYCRCYQLVADLDARVVFCTVPRCEDKQGMPPVASMTTGPDGLPMLEWADGLIEVAPDLDPGEDSGEVDRSGGGLPGVRCAGQGRRRAREVLMDFETVPGVVRAEVVIDLADGTRYTYELSAGGAKVAFDSGDRLDPGADLALDLGPDHSPLVIEPPYRPPLIVFAFPLALNIDRRSQVSVRQGPARPGGA